MLIFPVDILSFIILDHIVILFKKNFRTFVLIVGWFVCKILQKVMRFWESRKAIKTAVSSSFVEAYMARTNNTWDQYDNKVKGLIGDFANKRKQVLVKTYKRENSSGGTGLFGGWGGQSSGSVLGGGSSSSSGSGLLLRWINFFYMNQNQQQSSSLFGGCSNNQNKSIFWSNNSIFYSFWISHKYFIRNNWRRCFFFFKDLQKYPRSCQDCECHSQQRREGGNWICCRRSSRRNNICLGVITIDTITTLLTIKMSKNISNPSTKILL